LSIPKAQFRWWVASLLLAASILNYFDRQTLSVLKSTLEHDLSFNDSRYAVLINIFLAAYAISYIVSGWLVDKLGSRRSLTVFATLWSAATIGCGMATSFAGLSVMRGLLGIAEPGVQPVTVRAGAVWAPPEARGTFMTFCSLGSSIGAIAAPPAIAFLSVRYSWRLSFVLPGLLGFVVAAVWLFTYREPLGVTRDFTEATQAVALPWLKLWTKPSLWGIILVRFIGDPVWYFVLFWMIGYLQDHKGATLQQIGRLAWIPFIAANIGGIALVFVSDFLAKRSGSKVKSRKIVLTVLSVAAPLAWFIPHARGLVLPIVLFSAMAIISNTWLYMLSPLIAEIFPLGNVASIWGIVGAFGCLGTIVFNAVVSRIQHTDSGYLFLFVLLGLLHPLAALVLNGMVHSPLQPAEA
jgi:ACS family hexuronate transporter-like MFS transporter